MSDRASRRWRELVQRREATRGLLVAFEGPDEPPSGRCRLEEARRLHVRNYYHPEGKILTTSRIGISRDGKTRTNTVTGKTAQGLTIENTVVFEKQ